MRLFEEKVRDLAGPMAMGGRHFEYLDRSGRAEAARVRDFLERAFSSVPPELQPGFAARMAAEGHGYMSASFELILHELLRFRGLSVQIEAPKKGTEKKPDFLVSAQPTSFYLEAVLATEASPERVGERQRLAQLIDIVNKMESVNFFTTFEIQACGPAQPSARDIKAYLTTKLASLDPDDESIWPAGEGHRGPAWIWEHEGWSIVFHPTPKREDARGKPGRRPVGAIIEGLEALSTDAAIRAAFDEKAGKYGLMDRPYVIAINVLSYSLDEIDYLNALFGTEVVVETEGGPGPIRTRESNGVLGSAKNPRYTRVSAVAFFENIDPWTAAQRKALLIHNPWAARPMPSGLLGIDELRYVRGARQQEPGRPLWGLLDLYPEWPRAQDSSGGSVER